MGIPTKWFITVKINKIQSILIQSGTKGIGYMIGFCPTDIVNYKLLLVVFSVG
jgi:hypothetical protein